MTNIRDLARVAGVSVSTVSRVLNDHPYVADDKRHAVQQAIHELGYIRNQTAVHLARGRTKTIGVVLPYVDHPYYSAILQGIARRAFDADYRFLMWQTNYEEERERLALQALSQREVEGLIVVSHALAPEEFLKFEDHGRIVFCENHPDVSTVYVDHYAGFRSGLEELIRLGHEKIGICLSREHSVNSIARKRAYFDLVPDARKEWIDTPALTVEDGARIASRWLASSDRPTALLIASDYVASGVYMTLRKAGIRVPEDISLIGFDGHPLSAVMELTTISIPCEEIGSEAFRLVTESEKTERIMLPFELVSRKTTSVRTDA